VNETSQTLKQVFGGSGKGVGMKRSSAVRFVVVLAIVSLCLHFVFGWFAAADEAAAHGDSATWSDYLVLWGRDTFENLQSEFWQLAVQFAILAGLLKRLSVQAHEEDQEHIKAELAEVKAMLAERDGRADLHHPNGGNGGTWHRDGERGSPVGTKRSLISSR
jgi:hypothetical protein